MSAKAWRAAYTEKPVDWRAPIQEELREVENFLSETIHSDVQTINDVFDHLLSAGGKRLRPALVILSSQTAFDTDTNHERVTAVAAVVELIHMASLMHDDVIDHSDSRRGRVTANAFWGNRISILSGDYILAKAFRLLLKDNDQRIMDTIADTTTKMSEIEVLQSMCEHSIENWKKNYWEIVRNKTAGFMSACCRCGAILSGADSSTEEALAKYGMELGMAFQLTDDILDIAGEQDVVGKPIGSDLREGKFTLPVLIAFDAIPEEEKESIRKALERPENTEDDVRKLCEKIRSLGAVESAREQAKSFIERANDHLKSLPPSDARDALTTLSSNILYRTR
ncbi:MAG: polyprenyl synthetase family protein [Armatimonadota bacterium]